MPIAENPTDITKIIEVIILVVVAPFVPILASRLKAWFDASVSAKQQAVIIEAARLAVLAVEQAGLSGEAAKARALALADSQLRAQGVSVNFERLGVIVEALVMDEFNRFKALPAIAVEEQ